MFEPAAVIGNATHDPCDLADVGGRSAASGDRAGVTAQYEACNRVLLQELGVEPMEETTALYHYLLSGMALPPDITP